MELEEIINKEKLLDITLFNSESVIYTGVCLKANGHIWIIVNYDNVKREYDGFTIFKNNDVQYYEVYKKKFVHIKNDNLSYFTQLLNLQNVNTFYSCIKKYSKLGLFAIFLEDKVAPYYIGKIISYNTKKIEVELINNKGKWAKIIFLDISEIKFISFHSQYERKLELKLKLKSNNT